MPCTSHDSCVTKDWLTQLAIAIPSEITAPCKISLGLNIDDSPATLAKLNYLINFLNSKYTRKPAYSV